MRPPVDPANVGDLRQLQSRYKGLQDHELVAFIDESYRLSKDCRPGEAPFYVMAAVLLRKGQHADIRADLEEIAGGDRWHTTSEQQTSQGRARVQQMVGYLSDYRDPCVIAVRHTPGEEDGSIAMRALCLGGLLQTLESPELGGGSWDAISMAVLEKQRERKDTDRDRHTVSETRKAGRVTRHLPVHWVSPSIESLLWLPDLVTNTYRRFITHDDSLVMQLDEQTVMLDLPGQTSDPLAAAAYLQGVSSPFQ